MIVLTIIRTGGTVEQSGIYKCTKCGNEITCVKGERVPPCRNCGNTVFRLVRATR
ncbi:MULTISPECIES: YjzC family protein [unclassified Geobacillus]|uniref:zinc ribbon-containing protein n=1 Tax=unclassified Geobacillus TaxID=2642459 RepID=UPI000BE33BBA|nr:YjzC family protein [Parageobacillus yumthangensis]